jgi:hypothetical protein
MIKIQIANDDSEEKVGEDVGNQSNDTDEADHSFRTAAMSDVAAEDHQQIVDEVEDEEESTSIIQNMDEEKREQQQKQNGSLKAC